MGAIENYPIDIIKRTKEILEDSKLHAVLKKEDREVTFLLNLFTWFNCCDLRK